MKFVYSFSSTETILLCVENFVDSYPETFKVRFMEKFVNSSTLPLILKT